MGRRGDSHRAAGPVVHERVAAAFQCAHEARAARAPALSDAAHAARRSRSARAQEAAESAAVTNVEFPASLAGKGAMVRGRERAIGLPQMDESGSVAAQPQTRWQKVAARLDAYERLIRLNKPIGTLLLLWPT